MNKMFEIDDEQNLREFMRIMDEAAKDGAMEKPAHVESVEPKHVRHNRQNHR
jgi:hypothetical protein